MKFKFYPQTSKLYDFLKWPRLLFFKEDYEGSEDNSNYKYLVTSDYLGFVTKGAQKLKPYEKEIEIFYIKQFLNEYDFIDLISKANSIFHYKDEKEYLDMLLTLNEQDINTSIVYSIIMEEDGHDSRSEMMNKAKKISSDKDELILFIKELPIEAAAKWNLFLIVQEPLKYMKKYVILMTQLLPIFEEFYSPYELEIKNYGQQLVEFLNINGDQGLEEITYSIVDRKTIGEEEINILISVMFSYAMTVMTVGENKYIAWGLKMEEAFKKMKEINENKTNERVQIFKNLGDKTRYEVLKLIASGETSTKEIAKALDVSSATISYHISNLLTSKIIKINQSKGKNGYRIDYELLEEIIEGFKKDLKFL
ncbi:MAG: winged helix-turn-helix transcriptional regulator [Epulopiscium sp.]|nr:winged helix-turn-helix transcriptional regulator [Candidatus Epulonipiscium sp.]